MLRFDSKHHVIILKDGSGRTLWRAQLIVKDHAGSHPFQAEGPQGAKDGCVGRADAWPLRLSFASSEAGIDQLTIGITPLAKRTLQHVFLRIAGGKDAMPPLDSSETRMLAFPTSSSKEDSVVGLEEQTPLESSFATVLYHREPRRALLFGVGSLANDFSLFRVDGETLHAGFCPDRVIEKEEMYCLAFGERSDPLELLDVYGDYLMGFARSASGAQTGWNSWDYYGGAISMADVRKEMAAIHASPLKGKLKHIVLDMGWESSWGDWRPNRKFPATLRTIAREIEDAGFVPGIWTAPLQCHIFSPLGRHRQDLFVRDPSGVPVLCDRHALFDFTLPEVHACLRKWFEGMRDAGFRFFKLDYTYRQYIDRMDRYADTSLGKAGVIRKGLAVIREAVGDDSYVLNCGAPWESALGLADSARASTDIHTFWGHIKHNARQISARLWQNGKLWRLDPDFAIVRARETTGDRFLNYLYNRRPLRDGESHWMAGPEASYSELLVWLTQVYLSAGNVFLSDSIHRLNEKGIETLNRLLPPLEESARPLDLFQNPIPRFWLVRSGKRSVLGVFNWEDQEAPIALPDGLDLPSEGVDIWTGKRIVLSESTRMEGHSAWLLEV